MNYRQTLEYLYSQLPMFQRIGAAAYKADLNNTLELCRILGNPERKFLSVHIAGTNGKGSVSHMLASILQEAGFNTGLHTSPHLKDFRERIRINGRIVPASYVTTFVKRYKDTFDLIRPSFFEYTAVMAFSYFADEQVDIAILETGMGGRLDSTNVVTPVLSVITNISMDHMTFLGDTMEKIATEKAGIIKPGIPVVIGELQEETRQVFSQKAAQLGSPLVTASEEYAVLPATTEKMPSGQMMDVFNKDSLILAGLKCPLLGKYQRRNISTLLSVTEQLVKAGFRVDENAIRQGIMNVVKNTGLKGRWQVVGRMPKVILDVAHNEAGLKEVISQLQDEEYERLHWVLGMVNDKDTGSILGMLPGDALYYFCKPEIPRGLDASLLAERAQEADLRGKVFPSVRQALDAAISSAGKEDLVLVAGSTFVVAEVV